MRGNRRATIWIVVVGLTLLLAGSYFLTGRPLQAQDLSLQAPVGATALGPLGAGFTFQGRLLDGSNPASGGYDLQFKLYDALSGGAQVGGTVSRDDVAVAEGLLTVELDFGSAPFTGEARWLEMAVRAGSSTGTYTTLAPRLALTATPYALSLRPGASVQSATGNVLNLSTTATSGAALNATASASTGNAAAVYGTSASAGGAGISGNNSSSGYGVYGAAGGSTGTPYGVYGLASHAGGATSYGVYGKSNSSVGTGVGGEAPMSGIYGKATASNGYGVYGEASAATGATYGVYGKANSATGKGVYGTAPMTGTVGIATGGGSTYGVYGQAASGLGTGVHGEGGFYGVYGVGADPTLETYGVLGISSGADGYGIWGQSTSRDGVHGESASAAGYGVYGKNTAGGTAYGVYGANNSSSGAGVLGKSGNAAGTGVRGETVHGHGVEGFVNSGLNGTGAGVYGDGGQYGYGGSFENATIGTPTVLIQNYHPGGPALEVQGAAKIVGDAHIDGNVTWAPKTSYVSIPPTAFLPGESGLVFDSSGWGFWRNQPDVQEARAFYAPVQLPHGARVTRFTLYWSTWVDYPEEPGYFELLETAILSGEIYHEGLIHLYTTPEVARRIVSSSEAADHVVRNDVASYYVKAQLPGYIMIHLVIIEYELSEPY